MEEDSVIENEIDAYLGRVQRETKFTLNKLSKLNVKVTKPVVDHFYNVTCKQ